MEVLINTIDTVLSLADVIDMMTAFFQREDVQRIDNWSKQVAQTGITLLILLMTVIVLFSFRVMSGLRRAWVEALPVAVSAFQAGYRETNAPVLAQLTGELQLPEVALVEVSSAAVKTKSQVQQLRQRCQSAGIRWRNANGTHKHLTVKQMQEALEQQ